MEHLNLNEVTWYIVFTDENVSKHWLHPVLKKEFHHCYCFRQIGDMVYMAEPTTANIDSRIYKDISARQLAIQFSRREATRVLKFKYEFDFNNKMFNLWNLVPTCVSVVKMFLGIKAKAQTPYQLYKHLLKQGATPFN